MKHARTLVAAGLIVPTLLVTALITVVRNTAHAVEGGTTASHSAGQVLIYEDGQPVGTGSLVDRNWVLTAVHVLERIDNPSLYAIRFGMTRNNPGTTINRRPIDNIVPHPTADLALIHFADAVPAGTWMPTLATRAPDSLARAIVYGWGPDGSRLNRIHTIIAAAVATANTAFQREHDPAFAWDFPAGVAAMVVNAFVQGGDSGGATISPSGVLLGIHTGMTGFRWESAAGNLYGPAQVGAYDQPVWEYRDWINGVIRATTPPPNDELRRRRLIGKPTVGWPKPEGRLSITVPPQDGACDPDATCDQPAPKWSWARLVAPGSNRGTVSARCVDLTANTCAFGTTTYKPGASATLKFGALGATGIRNIMVWCTTKTSLTTGDPAGPVFRFSFINDDGTLAFPGYGLWDASTAQVTSDGTKTIDPSSISAC